MRAGREGEKNEKRSRSQRCCRALLYISTYGPPCSSCECHDHTNYRRQSHLLTGIWHVVFKGFFFSLFRLRNHPQMMQHTMCTCSVLLIGHFGINFNSGYRQHVTKLCSATMQRCPPMIKQKNILQESL